MLTIEKLIILKSIDLFAQIPEKELIWLASQIEQIELEANSTIMTQGEIGTSMYVIIEGEVSVIIDQKEVATLGEKKFFGELAALDPEARSATIKTITQTTLFKIDRKIIFDLVNEYQDIAQTIIKILCQRIRSSK